MKKRLWALAVAALLISTGTAWGSYVTNPVPPQFTGGQWVYIYDFYCDGDLVQEGYRTEEHLSLTGFDATQCGNIDQFNEIYQRWDLTAAEKNYWFLPSDGWYPSTNNQSDAWALTGWPWAMINLWHAPSEYTEGYPVISPGYVNCLGIDWYDLTVLPAEGHYGGLYLTVRIVHPNPPTGILDWMIGDTGSGQIVGPGPASAPVVSTDSYTNVLPDQATVNGTLSANGPAFVYVCYGETDGGTNATDWTYTNGIGQLNNGPAVTDLTGLSANATYFFRFFAENSGGLVWSTTSLSFTTPKPFATWPNKKKISFAYDRSEVLNNFPALVVLTPANFDYGSLASADGGDLRFSAFDQVTVLPYEVESWDTNGDSYVWVQLDSLASNTSIWMLWGNTNETTAPQYTVDGSTWSDGGYLAVWHLNATNAAGEFPESTANGPDGVNHECAPVAGVIANGQDLATSNRIDVSGLFHAGGSDPNRCYTFHFWLSSSQAATDQYIMDVQLGPIRFGWNSSVQGSVGYYDSAWRGDFGSGLNDSQWHHVVFVLDGATASGTAYVDGFPVGSQAYTPQDLGGQASVGSDAFGAGTHYDGYIDELRVSTVARSSNWVWATWISSVSNATFNTFGTTIADVDLDGINDAWEMSNFGALTNANEKTDNDGDGSWDYWEYIAGMDPTNSDSFFGVTNVVMVTVSNAVLSWPSVSNRVYEVDGCSNLPGGVWTRVVTNLPATPPENSVTVRVDSAQSFFKAWASWSE